MIPPVHFDRRRRDDEEFPFAECGRGRRLRLVLDLKSIIDEVTRDALLDIAQNDLLDVLVTSEAELPLFTVNATRGTRTVPDLLLAEDGRQIAVEVYLPQVWEGLAEYRDDLTDAAKNLDVPFDYEFEVRIEQLHEFRGEKLLFLQPSDLARGLGDPARRRFLLGSLIAELAEQLHPAGEISEERIDEGLNIRTTLAFRNIKESSGHLPARFGLTSGPPLSGYRPEWFFRRIVERAMSKAARQQAVALGADIAILLIDLSSSELASELRHPTYRRTFEAVLGNAIRGGLAGYDVVALCEARDWSKGFITHFVAYEDSVDEDSIHRMLGAPQGTE